MFAVNYISVSRIFSFFVYVSFLWYKQVNALYMYIKSVWKEILLHKPLIFKPPLFTSHGL